MQHQFFWQILHYKASTIDDGALVGLHQFRVIQTKTLSVNTVTGVTKPVQEGRAAAAANKSALITTLKVDKLLRLNNDDAGPGGEVVVAMDGSAQTNDKLAKDEECEEGSTQLACAR